MKKENVWQSGNNKSVRGIVEDEASDGWGGHSSPAILADRKKEQQIRGLKHKSPKRKENRGWRSNLEVYIV